MQEWMRVRGHAAWQGVEARPSGYRFSLAGGVGYLLGGWHDRDAAQQRRIFRPPQTIALRFPDDADVDRDRPHDAAANRPTAARPPPKPWYSARPNWRCSVPSRWCRCRNQPTQPGTQAAQAAGADGIARRLKPRARAAAPHRPRVDRLKAVAPMKNGGPARAEAARGGHPHTAPTARLPQRRPDRQHQRRGFV